ncbi:M14 family metallopeptidase [Ferrimonas balearica]|uniref:M14 family metallopeptidase n=1 Tax=Ferrimonas balearica TaxID=44012 RepID=UPI001C992034|nr:M14 family metallopeptidase [Ferrimonas balearica]MBY5990616.1 peptidase M14 [Ferrimonas balearica]
MPSGKIAGLLLALMLLSRPLGAEPLAWPEVAYDPAIPTVAEVLGYPVGARISTPAQARRYFDALVAAAPNRIRLVEYAQSWEGRPLYYTVIGTPERLADLTGFAADMQALADPRQTDEAQAEALIGRLPASLWLGYAVHGNEISGTDAAMLTAYHLLAAQDHPMTQTILADSLVFIDPLQNPDGRARFTSRYYATVGLAPSDDRLSAEHNEPWPRGRTNHYLFDMNRDWLAQTQPETRGRIAVLNHYLPLVVIDLHEMGGDESYYFAPPAQPLNPHMSPTQLANIGAIGRNHGRHFDAFGFDYFTREVFDAFYPGYGDSWPVFYGAAASTYEVGSARGHHFRRRTGEQLTYADTVLQHFVASLSTAEAVAAQRQKLLRDFHQYQRDAIAAGRSDSERLVILPPQSDRAGQHRLATLMARHGVEVHRASQDFRACGQDHPAGSVLIDLAQPRGRFAKTTLTEQVAMDAEFVAEQERRRARRLDNEIYDVTGWSLPLMFNLDVARCNRVPKVATTAVTDATPLVGEVVNPEASVAFLVPWQDMAAGRFLAAALQRGLTVKSAEKAFTLEGGQGFGAGTLILERRRNGEDLAAQVQALARQTGARVLGVDTSWVVAGPSFGSGHTPTLMAPKIALAWDEPTEDLSAGNTRFVIERQLGYPVTAIRTTTLASADLSGYQVLVLPSGDYAEHLDPERLTAWMERGGVLITLGEATVFAADSGLLATRLESALAPQGAAEPDAENEPEVTRAPGSQLASADALAEAVQAGQSEPDHVAGVLARVSVDTEHWLTAGVKPELIALVEGNDIFAPLTLEHGRNLAWFNDADTLLASGHLWQENREQLAYKPFLLQQGHGKGMVIGFTQAPTTRAYLEGLNLLFTNTLLRSPAHTR